MSEVVRVASQVGAVDSPGANGANGATADGHGRRDLSHDELRDVRERTVAKHMPLVYRLSRRFDNCGEPIEDLVQVGAIGLLKAIAKFDESRGFKFVTYAVPVIVGEIKNYLRDHGWAVKVPRKLQRNKLMVHRATDALSHTLGHSPEVPEIASATGLSEQEVYDTFEVANFSHPLSLEAEYPGDGGRDASRLLDYVGAEDPRFEALSDKLDLADTMRSLDRREMTIIYLKFYAGLSQSQIAKRMGISQMHVSRLQRHALGKLRAELNA